MSVNVMTFVWKDEYYQQGDKAKLLVALAIADNATDDGFAFPSVDYIAMKARCRPRGVQEICRELEKDGKLEVQPGKGRNGTNLYRLLGVRLPHPSDKSIRVKQDADTAGCAERRVRSSGGKSAGISAGKNGAGSHPNHQEPSGTIKNHQEPKAEKPAAVSEDGLNFADVFRKTLPETSKLSDGWRESWGRCFDDLIRLDHRTPDQIRAVCNWARCDSFWASNFMSPLKLRSKNQHGTFYFDVFSEKLKGVTPNGKPGLVENLHARVEEF